MRYLFILLICLYASGRAQSISLPPDFEVCQPSTKAINLQGSFDAFTQTRIALLFAADQSQRNDLFSAGETSEPALLANLLEADLARRVEIYSYLVNGQVASGQAFYQAAFIFHHGDCSDHFDFANKLAKRAIDLGYEEAKWLYAASLDRYLLCLGEKQKFGTQFELDDDCFYKPKPLDSTTTDEERKAYNVPSPLQQAKKLSQAYLHCD